MKKLCNEIIIEYERIGRLFFYSLPFCLLRPIPLTPFRGSSSFAFETTSKSVWSCLMPTSGYNCLDKGQSQGWVFYIQEARKCLWPMPFMVEGDSLPQELQHNGYNTVGRGKFHLIHAKVWFTFLGWWNDDSTSVRAENFATQ